MLFRVTVAVFFQLFRHIVGIKRRIFRFIVGVPGEKVHGAVVVLDVLHELEKQINIALTILAPGAFGIHLFQGIEPDRRITADFDLRKFRLQQLGGHIIQFQILFPRSGPHHAPPVGTFRLIPDFPVLDIVLKAVRPAFGVVTDHARADLRPFFRVFRRVHTVRLPPDFVLNGHAETVIRLHFGIHQTGDQRVRPGKVVRRRIVRVRIEIRKDIGNINKLSAAETAAHVVQAGIGNPCFRQIVEKFVTAPADDGGLTDRMDRLHFAGDFREIDFDFCHGLLLGC